MNSKLGLDFSLGFVLVYNISLLYALCDIYRDTQTNYQTAKKQRKGLSTHRLPEIKKKKQLSHGEPSLE